VGGSGPALPEPVHSPGGCATCVSLGYLPSYGEKPDAPIADSRKTGRLIEPTAYHRLCQP
jgi:hypothetical protein